VVCHVGKQKPITDKHLKEQILRRPRDYELHEEFKRELKKSGSNEEERRWKEFVKLARSFDEIPAGKRQT
jgi:hypothetical protein